MKAFLKILCHFDLANHYCIAGKFGELIGSFWEFGERKVGELIDQPIGY